MMLPGARVFLEPGLVFRAESGGADADRFAVALEQNDRSAIPSRERGFDRRPVPAGPCAGGFPGRLLEGPGIDWVVVEADGSRRLPVKAPAEHEPVIPGETTTLVSVAGIDALSGPIAEVAHRPERVSEVTGLPQGATLTPEALGLLLASNDGGGKGAPPGASRVVMVNKVASEADFALTGQIASAAMGVNRVDRVVAGALRGHPLAGWRAWLR